MSRPKITDVSPRDVAEELYNAVMEWGNPRNYSQERLIDVLERAIRSVGMSGFHIAKELENYGFDPDGELVEILESSWYIRNRIHYDLVSRWVSENNVQPSKAIADQVAVMIKGEKCSGIISSITLTNGQYLVCVPEHGHVQEGQGPHGYLINYEDILQ